MLNVSCRNGLLFLFMICTKSVNASSNGAERASATRENKKIIVWNLIDVLLEPHRGSMGKHIMKKSTGGNPFKIIKLGANVPTEEEIKHMMKDVLDTIPTVDPEEQAVTDGSGGKLSNTHRDYLSCKISAKKLLPAIRKGLQQRSSEGYFKNKTQENLVSATMETVFNPEVYANYIKPSKQGLQLLQRLAQQGHTMIALGNWDCESFALVQKQPALQEVLRFFAPENLFISGLQKTVTGVLPCAWLESYLKKHDDLHAEDFILIDNLPDNIKSARSCGMQAILLEKHGWNKVQAELSRLGAL